MTAFSMRVLKRRAQMQMMNAWRCWLMDERQEQLIEQFGADKAAAGGRLKVSDASKAISSRIISEFGVIGAFHLGGRTGSRS